MGQEEHDQWITEARADIDRLRARAGRRRVAAELLEEMIASGPTPDPLERARRARLIRDIAQEDVDGYEQLAEQVRAQLQAEAAQGEQVSSTALEILSDDPWWQEP